MKITNQGFKVVEKPQHGNTKTRNDDTKTFEKAVNESSLCLSVNELKKLNTIKKKIYTKHVF